MPRTTDDVLPAGQLSATEQPTLTGGRIRLRPWRTDDRDAVVAAFTDPDIEHWHLRRITTEAEADDWIADRHQTWKDESGASWAVVDTDDTVLGQVALRGVNLAMGVAQVSYWVLPATRRDGVATRALQTLSPWVLEEVGFHRLWLMHSTGNPPSCAVASAAGFETEGTMREALRHVDGWHDMHVHGRIQDRTQG